MGENSFRGDNRQPVVETEQVKTRKLKEGESTGWEHEHRFTQEEVLAVIKGLDINSGDLKVTEQLVSHEGVLLISYMRTLGRASGYSYMLKGNHGPNCGSKETEIFRIDYSSVESEDVEYAEIIAEYKNNAWVKR